MPTDSIIRILEKEPNKQGDLFGRLIGDLFLSLGYDRLVRLNVHKSGRELDIEVEHRTEARRAIAECKTTKDLTGGDEINKFIGALDVEKHKNPHVQITGYFISLSGFKETAIEQERDAGGNRVILLNGEQVVKELISGRIIVAKEKAMEWAGRYLAQTANLIPDAACELLAHAMGWIWVIYFTQNKQRTHFALIHADGEAIAPALAETIIQSDMSVGGTLHSLTYLRPSTEPSISEEQNHQVKTKYFEYLAVECGEITMEGLPANQEVGSHRLKLENIFVPLYLEPSSEYGQTPSSSGISIITDQPLATPSSEYGQTPSLSPEIDKQKADQKAREPVGKVLSLYSRLAILAAPGGGKTTLIKRLAVAYAFPDRRRLIDDNLPDRSWLPLFIRCRQLGNMVKSSISDILCAIPQRAEMGNLENAFVNIVNSSLRSGDALLLVDGLDEISDEGIRVSFVNQLRTFLATYPNVNIVITSREAGFRIVGGALSTHCKYYKVADFDDEDIKRLTLAWHKEVIGDRPEVRLEAEKLAKTIIESDRVRQLTKNPLLLTTLLLVKRWVGQIPTRRSILYGKAIEVLLMTWNVEGYAPLEQDEAIPQLAFVAFTMMKDGVQRISSRRLKEVLILARKQMPEVLGYARFNAPEFIQRIELRSSLLILSGHEIEQGTLYPMYEFRHLTFQEYLTARAVVEGYYPDRKDGDTLLKILKPHLADERWKEVIPLAAVLAGRNVQPLIRHLINLCKKLPPREYSPKLPLKLLSQAILDEIQISPELLGESLEWIARRSYYEESVLSLYRGRYGKELLKIVQDTYSSNTDLPDLGSALFVITLEQINFKGYEDLSPQLFEKITTLLEDENKIQKAAGALATMIIAFGIYSQGQFRSTPDQSIRVKQLNPLGDKLIPILYSDEPHLHFAACWAFVWLGNTEAWTPDHKPDVISRLFEIWRESKLSDVQQVASWAISSLPLIDRELKPLPEPDQNQIDFVKQHDHNKASLIIAFYWKTPWADEELTKLVASKYKSFLPYEEKQRKNLLNILGEPGKAQLQALKKGNSSLRKPKAKSKKKEKSLS